MREEDLIEGGLLLAVLIVGVVSGVASYTIAKAKGHDGTLYFLLGLLMPIIGILVAGFMPPAAPRMKSSLNSPVHPLAVLRETDDPKVAEFLLYTQPRLSIALDHCKAGERILAFGTGSWGKPGLFLLTDQRLIFTRTSNKQTTVVDQVDRFELDKDRGELRSPDGVLAPYQNSPFTAHELDARIRHRRGFEPYVEVIAPGKLARPKPPRVDEPVVTPVQPATATVEELERLDALRRSGAIDDAEFAELKRRAMWGEGGPTESNG